MGGWVGKAVFCYTGGGGAGTSRGGEKAGMRDGRPKSWPSLAADPLCDLSLRGVQ